MECVSTRTQRFNLLPSLAFLCMVPLSSLERVPVNNIIRIRPGPFSDILHALLSELDAVLTSARVLLRPSCRRQLESDAVVDEAEE